MDFQNGQHNDYHLPPFDTKEAHPSKSVTALQQDLASHGVAEAGADLRINAIEETYGSTTAPQSELKNVDEDVGSSENVVDGYIDKKMGGANF
jgi:hypothetical protein